jgi:hypothetical protein
VVFTALGLVLGGCMTRPAPEPTSPALEITATRKQLASGPLQSVLPELAARASVRGAALVLPTGQYDVSESILLPRDTYLRLATGAELVGNLPGRPLLRLASGSTLEGGTLRNDADSPGFDLDLAQDSRQVTVRGVTFRGAATNSLYLAASGVRDVLIDGNRFEQVGYGVLLNPPAQNASSITVRGNTFVDACADAIEINAPTGGTAQRVKNVVITGNRMSGTCGSGPDGGFGVGLAGVDGFTIEKNSINGARNEAVHVEDGTTHGTIRNNRIAGGGHGDRPAIALYRTTSDIDVDDNDIADFVGGGIAVRWDGLGSARAISIERNHVRSVTGDGIVVSGGIGTGPFDVDGNVLVTIGGNGISAIGPHERTVITGNSLRDVAGEAIVELQRGDGQTLISGNSIG